MTTTQTTTFRPADDVMPTCPLCKTADTTITTRALVEGAYWRCARCGQVWDALRLQTAADYQRSALLL